jgi:hypothetical protein
MHYLTLSYPDNPTYEEQQKIKNFFMMIGDYLPCEKCRINYKRHQTELPLTDEILQSRDKLIFWLFDLHNIVNAETGKNRFTKDEFLEEYRFDKDDKQKNHFFNKYIIFILVIVLLILFLLYKKFN